jgi:hypothetical protein
MEEQIKSVLNFEGSDRSEPINSPRSLEACLRAGFDPSELQPRCACNHNGLYAIRSIHFGHMSWIIEHLTDKQYCPLSLSLSL